ncbi:MAG: hypothetical protein K6A67_05060 [Bacteroidales bacterium]|nr:hypothetical protein [Bacteroidales bacterium]
MKKYTHDYTLPSKANSILCEAQEAMRHDDTQTAERLIGKARQVLDIYLAEDNMIPDEEGDLVRVRELEN